MPVQVILDVIPYKAITQEQVQLPDNCPHCGTDLHQPGVLVEKAFTLTAAGCLLHRGELEHTGQGAEFWETEYVVAYECSRCDEIIVGNDSIIRGTPGEGPSR